mgnify:CR=1 FL=1|jgi:hypothetical protein
MNWLLQKIRLFSINYIIILKYAWMFFWIYCIELQRLKWYRLYIRKKYDARLT